MRIEHYKLLGTRQDPKSQAPLSLEAHSAAAADRPEISISVSGVEYCARKQKENERTCSRGWKTCPGPEPGCPTEQLRPERGLEEVKGLTGRALQEEAKSPEGGTLREGRRGRCGWHGGAGPARVGGGCGRAPTLLLASARVDSSGFPGQETQARARHSLCRKDSALPRCLGAAWTPRTQDAERVGVAVAGVPQVTGEAELLSMYLLASCTSSLGRCQFQSVAHFLIGLFTVVFFFFLFFPSFYLEAGEWALEATFRRSQGPLSEGRGLAVTGSLQSFAQILT